MSIFNENIRKIMLVNRKKDDLYLHNHKDRRIFIVDENMKKNIFKANTEYHVAWATLISGVSVFYEYLSSLKYGFIAFIIYIFFMMWILEIYYSIKVYNIIDTKKIYKGNIDISKFLKKAKPQLLSFISLGFFLMTGLFLFFYIEKQIEWKSFHQKIIFSYAFNFVLYFSLAFLFDIKKRISRKR